MLKKVEHVKNHLYTASMDLVTEHKLARRAAILKTARQMIAEKGYEAITVRDLAAACRVSVPTLYNQFGGKDQVLAAAIEDHFVGDPNQAQIQLNLDGLDRINAIFDFITAQFLEAPAFHRRLLEAFGSLESTTRVQERITESLATEIAGELATMKMRDELCSWADVKLLASQITTAFTSSTIVWGSGAIDDDQLVSAVRYATGLVLLGVAINKAQAQLEQRLMEAQPRLQKSLNQ